MTTYNNNMAANEQIAMPELYEFRRGFERGYYTSYPEDLLFQSHIYLASSISRSDFTTDANMNTVSLKITAAIISDFATYVAYEPSQRTRVIIYRAVSDDMNEFAIIFDGQITNVAFNTERVATAHVEQRASILDREVQMYIHQLPCNHHIFDSGCRLDPLVWRVLSSVSVSGNTLFSNDFDAYEDGYFTGGEVHYEDDARLITNHVGSTLTLQVPFSAAVQTGTTVTVYPGCSGIPTVCRDKFNNILRYLGMAYIPNKNPAVWGV